MINTVKIPYVFKEEPLYWKYGNPLSGGSINLLALESVLEPGLRCKINCLANIQSS